MKRTTCDYCGRELDSQSVRGLYEVAATTGMGAFPPMHFCSWEHIVAHGLALIDKRTPAVSGT